MFGNRLATPKMPINAYFLAIYENFAEITRKELNELDAGIFPKFANSKN